MSRNLVSDDLSFVAPNWRLEDESAWDLSPGEFGVHQNAECNLPKNRAWMRKRIAAVATVLATSRTGARCRVLLFPGEFRAHTKASLLLADPTFISKAIGL